MWDCWDRSSSTSTRCLNTLFVRYGCGTREITRKTFLKHVLIPYSSGMGVGRPGRTWKTCSPVLIPYSSGMGVGQRPVRHAKPRAGLNTLFVRYGCGTPVGFDWGFCPDVLIPYSSGMGVGPRRDQYRNTFTVLIPYSSGMGVGRSRPRWPHQRDVLIPYSSGMGVGQ